MLTTWFELNLCIVVVFRYDYVGIVCIAVVFDGVGLRYNWLGIVGNQGDDVSIIFRLC